MEERKAAKRREREAAASTVSTRTWIGSAVGLIGIGMVGGIYHVFNQEKVKFNRHTHGRPALVAMKALMYGTVLAFGAFGIGVGGFMKVTGITTFKEFGRVCTEMCKPLVKPSSPEEVEEDHVTIDYLENLWDSTGKTTEEEDEAGNGSGGLDAEDSHPK